MDAREKYRFRHGIPWPGWRAFSRAVLVETGTLAALTAVLVAIVFGLRAWGAWAWLVILPIPVLAGALRRPRHGWLLALEFSLALRPFTDLADRAWGPPSAGPFEPLPLVFAEVLFLAPLFWPLVALGRALGERAIGRVRHPVPDGAPPTVRGEHG